MPIYEYKCLNCNVIFEELRPVNDTSVIICGNCGSDNVVKQFSAFASNGGGSPSQTPSCGSGGFS